MYDTQRHTHCVCDTYTLTTYTGTHTDIQIERKGQMLLFFLFVCSGSFAKHDVSFICKKKSHMKFCARGHTSRCSKIMSHLLHIPA